MREFQSRYFPSRTTSERLRVVRLEKDYGDEIATTVLDGIQDDLAKNLARIRS